MRRAEWRMRADDPKTLLGWWCRGVTDHRLFRQRRVLLYALLPFIVCVGIGLAGGGWGWSILAFANLAFAASRPDGGSSRLASILPVPAPSPQFRAEMALARQGVITGTDEMAMMIVDGWLVAEGVLSSFSLHPSSVARLENRLDKGIVLHLTDESEVVLRGVDQREWLTLTNWRAGDLPEGESVFPPAGVHPQELARWKSWMILGTVIALAPNVIEQAHRLSPIGLYGFFLLGGSLGLYGGTKYFRLEQLESETSRHERQPTPMTTDLSPQAPRREVPLEGVSRIRMRR